MIKKKDICVLKFNTRFEPEETFKDVVFSDIKVPKKKFIINKGFKKTTNLGSATNFVKKEDGLYCDLEYEVEEGRKQFTNAYVSIYYDGDNIDTAKVDGISIGTTPNAQVDLRDNLVDSKPL